MRKKLLTTILAGTMVTCTAVGVMNTQAFNLGGLLKLGGVTYIVDQYGSEVNNFLNKVFNQNDMSSVYDTKVVPIVSVGRKGYVGAAQVTGTTEELNKVKAVAQIEADFKGMIRAKGLVPVDNLNPLKAERVQGVGVSAIIDIEL